jgi:hypothetical protein
MLGSKRACLWASLVHPGSGLPIGNSPVQWGTPFIDTQDLKILVSRAKFETRVLEGETNEPRLSSVIRGIGYRKQSLLTRDFPDYCHLCTLARRYFPYYCHLCTLAPRDISEDYVRLCLPVLRETAWSRVQKRRATLYRLSPSSEECYNATESRVYSTYWGRDELLSALAKWPMQSIMMSFRLTPLQRSLRAPHLYCYSLMCPIVLIGRQEVQGTGADYRIRYWFGEIHVSCDLGWGVRICRRDNPVVSTRFRIPV